MDVDGTLTDGKIHIGESGELFKSFSVKDGCGIKDILPQYDIIPVIITARQSIILEHRCKELNICHVYQGIRNKQEKMDEIIKNLSDSEISNYTYSNVAYIGDDILDLQCMKVIKQNGGLIGCPVDAVNSVKKISDYISTKPGGEGAVREFIEYIVEYQCTEG